MVPEAGIEPARPYERGIPNPLLWCIDTRLTACFVGGTAILVSVVCLLRVLNHYPTAQAAAVYWNEPDGHVWEILTVS